jgi:hypothetical protein
LENFYKYEIADILTQEIFNFLARRQGAVKFSIPASFDFITTLNEGVFLCSPCIIPYPIPKHESVWWEYRKLPHILGLDI